MFLLFSLAVAAHAHDSPRVGRSLLYSLVSTLDNIDFFFLVYNITLAVYDSLHL